MARRIGAHSEVARGFDERDSEVAHPHPVDHDPSRQGILGRGHGSGELEPTAALSERLAVGSGHNAQLLSRHLRSVIARIAALEDYRLRDAAVVHHSHGSQGRSRVRGIELIELALERPALLGHRRVEEPIDAAQRPLNGRIARIQHLPQFLRRRVGQGLGLRLAVLFRVGHSGFPLSVDLIENLSVASGHRRQIGGKPPFEISHQTGVDHLPLPPTRGQLFSDLRSP